MGSSHDAKQPLLITAAGSDVAGRSAFAAQAVDYEKENEEARKAIDAYYRIVRTLVVDAKYPTGVAVIRDTTNAREIGTPDDPTQVERENTKLRVLGRLRGIDFVLREKLKEFVLQDSKIDENDARKADYTVIIKRLTEITSELSEAYSLFKGKCETAQTTEALKDLEIRFNTDVLCNKLHEANLDEGCASAKDYKKLLFHYRNLSSLISPAQTQITISQDSKNNVIHRITQHPVTKKLDKQKEKIQNDMKKVVLAPTGEELSFQTKQPLCMQVANYYFADLAADDKRMFSAQTRKTHLHSIKNAFVVKNELMFDAKLTEVKAQNEKAIMLSELKAEAKDTQFFVRSSTPVYIGGGETDARIQEATRDNIQQVREFAASQLGMDATQLRVHCTCLVTDSPLENQHLMIRHTYDATRRREQQDAKHDDVSYAPCNWDGTNRRMNISSAVRQPPSIHPTPSNQAERYRRVAVVSNDIRGQTSEQEQIIELVSCASGQDRSETESEYATQEWIRLKYQEYNKAAGPKDPKKGDLIEQTRAKSRNSADINSHLVGGSRGCKNDSRGKTALVNYDNLFSPTTDRAMYLESATTNKKNKVDEEDATFKSLVHYQTQVAEKEYNIALKELNAAIEHQNNLQLKQAGTTLMSEIVSVGGAVPSDGIQSFPSRVKPKDLGSLTRITKQATTVIKGPVADNPAQYAGEVSRLGAISNKFTKKSVLAQIGYAALLLCGVALVVAGILFSIPSGGSSLLASVLGAKAIAVAGTALGIHAAIGVGTSAAATGTGVAVASSRGISSQTKHGIEKEPRLFSAVKKLKEEAQEKPEEKKEQSPRSHDGYTRL